MLTSVLNSPVAVRAFIRIRAILATHRDLARKLEELEKKYDRKFAVVFDAICLQMTPPKTKQRPIGFYREEK